jgi:hypothetical protein
VRNQGVPGGTPFFIYSNGAGGTIFTLGLSPASVEASWVGAAAAGGIFWASIACEATGGWSGLDTGVLGSSALTDSRWAGVAKGGFAPGLVKRPEAADAARLRRRCRGVWNVGANAQKSINFP